MQTRTLQRMWEVLLIIILIDNYALSRTVSGQLRRTFKLIQMMGNCPLPLKHCHHLAFWIPTHCHSFSLYSPDFKTPNVIQCQIFFMFLDLLYFTSFSGKSNLPMSYNLVSMSSCFYIIFHRQSVNKFHCATFKPYLHLTVFGLVLCFTLIQANTISHPN